MEPFCDTRSMHCLLVRRAASWSLRVVFSQSLCRQNPKPWNWRTEPGLGRRGGNERDPTLIGAWVRLPCGLWQFQGTLSIH